MKIRVIKPRPQGIYARHGAGDVIDVPEDERATAAKWIRYGFWEEYTEPAPQPEPEPVPTYSRNYSRRRITEEPTGGED